MSNLLSGISSLAYQGTNAVNPPNLIYATANPTQNDSTNVSLGDLWLNRINQTVWLLVALNASLATWVELGVTPSEVETLTGNSGGAVGPSVSNNINVVGDGTTITILGNAATHTLTASVVPGAVIKTLEGNTGGIVSSDGSGNFHVVGDGTTITIAGNPGTHTLTASVINSLAITMTGNSGGAVSASAGNFNIVGDGTTIEIVGNPGTHTLTASIVSGGTIDSITGNTGGAVHPDGSGNIFLLGTPGIITVTGNPGTHTLTIDTGSEVATSYTTDSGTATPSSGILRIAGGTNINTSGSGNTVTVNLNTTITGITNLTVNNLTATTSETLSFASAGVIQSDSSGHLSSTKGTDGQILISSSTGAPAWANITAGANVTITNGNNTITIAASGGGTGSGIVLVGSQSLIGQNSAAFTNTSISSTYTSYLLVADKILLPAVGSAAQVTIQLSSDNGATFFSGVFTCGLIYNLYSSTSFSNMNVNNGNVFLVAPIFSSASDQYISFSVFLYDLTTTNYAKNITGQFVNYNPTNLYQGQAAGASYQGTPPNSGVAVNNMLIQFNGTAAISGTIELYGLTH